MQAPTRSQIVAGLTAELAKSELSHERRQQLQTALDYQLEVDPDHAPPWQHRFAQVSGLGSAPRGDHGHGSDNYRADHCLAALRPKLPQVELGMTDAQELEILNAQRYAAKAWREAFSLRTETNRTVDGKAADARCRDEWAEYLDQLNEQITRVRNRVNQAARRGR